MQEIPRGAPGLVTPYLEEILESPGNEYAVILATVKCAAHTDNGEGTEQVAPVGVIDSTAVMGMDAAGRVILVETMGTRATANTWAQRQFKNRSYQPPDGLVNPRDAVIAHLATLYMINAC